MKPIRDATWILYRILQGSCMDSMQNAMKCYREVYRDSTVIIKGSYKDSIGIFKGDL